MLLGPEGEPGAAWAAFRALSREARALAGPLVTSVRVELGAPDDDDVSGGAPSLQVMAQWQTC